MIVVSFLCATVALSLALSAFCSGCEMGFFSMSRGRLVHLAHEGSRRAAILQKARANMSRTLTGILVGNNLANVVYSSSSAALAAAVFPSSAAARSVWSVCAALALLYLGEFLPKLFCRTRPLGRMLALSGVYRAFDRAMSPLTSAAMAVTALFMPKADAGEKEVSSADLLRILQDRKDGVRLTDFESALVSRILVLRRKGERVTAEAVLSALDEDDRPGGCDFGTDPRAASATGSAPTENKKG